MAQESRSIANLMQQLQQRVQMDFDAEEMADILWLALQRNQSAIAPSDSTPTPESPEVVMQPIQPLQPGSENALPSPPEVPITTELPKREDAPEVGTAVPIQIPDTTALPQSLALARSLRPLMRKVASQRIRELDEDATIQQIVDEKIWSPVMRPAPERWLELAIVVEETNLLDVWQETMTEFQALMERHGAFRDVRSWQLVSDADGSLQLFRRKGKSVARSNPRHPRELLDPTGRRLIIVVSDCTSSAWRSGQLLAQLEQWMLQTPVTVLQLLPERFWGRSVLGLGDAVWLSSSLPGALNQRLEIEGLSSRQKHRLVEPVTLPVVTLEVAPLLQWAKVIAGVGGQETAGVILDRVLFSEIVSDDALPPLTPDQLVQRFWRTASPIARKLAGLMAAVPVSWAVIRLIQRNLLPESSTIHLAEIFLSGLLRSQGETTSGSTRYDFVDGVRSRLIDVMSRTDVEIVLDEVADDFLSRLSVDLQERISADIERRIGTSLHSFDAFLLPDLLTNLSLDPSMRAEILPFATITSQVLQRLGDEYTDLVERLGRSTPASDLIQSIELPPLQEFQFRVATIDETVQAFEFTVATIELQAQGRRKPKLVIHREQKQAWQLIEELGDTGIRLEMVAIPAGSFVMGSPDDEINRYDWEAPQHEVNVSEFFMSKYPVTQAQWRFVADLPQVHRSLDPDPAHFKGDNRPVERVSWHDAVEFCERLNRFVEGRLSRFTGKQYRLPSEAEWEYACRAGTTSAFHFGETITSELANYDGRTIYGRGVKGRYREETTPVGSFEVANEFGLYDLHGNVWEWCQDHWHDNYEGAPNDGGAWIDADAEEEAFRVVRGGSWFNAPRYCRSASRYFVAAGGRYVSFGFRVVLSAPRTL